MEVFVTRLTKKDYLNNLLEDLKVLREAEDANDVKGKLKTEKAKEYVEGLRYSKPESLLADKFFRPILDVLRLFSLPESVGGMAG